jgi:hypothetical protein
MQDFFHAVNEYSAKVPFPPESSRTDRRAIVIYIEAYTLCLLSILVNSKQQPIEIIKTFFDAVRAMTTEQLWIFASYLYNMDGRSNVPADIKALFPDYILRLFFLMRRQGYHQSEFLIDAINNHIAKKLGKYIAKGKLLPSILDDFKTEVSMMSTTYLWTFYSFLTRTPRFVSSKIDGHWYDVEVIHWKLADDVTSNLPAHLLNLLPILTPLGSVKTTKKNYAVKKSSPPNIGVKKSPPLKPVKTIKK